MHCGRQAALELVSAFVGAMYPARRGSPRWPLYGALPPLAGRVSRGRICPEPVIQKGTLNEDRVECRLAIFSGGRCRRVFAADGRRRGGYFRDIENPLRQLMEPKNPRIKEHRGRLVYTGSAGRNIAVPLASRWRHHSTKIPATTTNGTTAICTMIQPAPDSIAPEANDESVTVPNTRKSLRA